MPSDAAAPSRWAWLRSQGLGLVCGQATVLLLGVGTFVIATTRDGASAEVQADDLTIFFREPGWTHLWLYALLPVAGLYALNTLLCTWDAAVARWRRRAPAEAWAPTVIHVAFLFALLAHGVGGFLNHDERPVVVGPLPVPLGDGRTLRLAALETDTTPSGMVKQVHAHLEVTSPGGRTEAVEVGYNQPGSWGLGSDLLLLAQVGKVRLGGEPRDAVQLRHRLAPGHPVALVSALLLLVGLVLMGRRWLKPAPEPGLSAAPPSPPAP